MNKSFRFLLHPTSEQRVLFAKTFGCCRFVYNRMLADKIAHYESAKELLRTTPAQYKREFEWLREVDSLALSNEQLHLEAAYRNFFRDKSIGFPKFKSKHRGHNSYTTNLVNGNMELADGHLKLPKLGRIKVKQHRQIPFGYQLKSVTVSLAPSGKYHASILYEYEADAAPVEPVNVLGLDFSMPELYIDSNGSSPMYPRPYRQAQEKLAREQRKMSHRKKGGKNRAKQKQKVARLHEHISNQRKDFLHKQSRRIANDYDAVCIEDLNMRGIAQSLNFGKSVADNGWGMFTSFLGYKLSEQGKRLVTIDKWFPSSKLCHVCGCVNDDLKLSDRKWTCESCGAVHHRDVNAAVNIRNEGLRLLNA
jgi:putative transposase